MPNFSAGFNDGFSKGFNRGFLNSGRDQKILNLKPYLWFKLNSSSGSNIFDDSGNARDQTLDGSSANFWKAGKYGNCGYFQAAATNKVSMPVNYFPINGTWCCWVKNEWSTLPAVNSRIFNTDDSRGTNYMHRGYIFSGALVWYVANGSTKINSSIGSLNVYDNQWIHIGWSWNYDSVNTNVRGYVNGSNIVGSNGSIPGTLIIPNVSLDIGFWGGGYFNGYMDDFLFFERCLSDSEMKTIHEA